MAQRIVETDEPVVQERQTVVHEDRPRSYLGLIVLAIVIIIILIIVFAWRPWGGSSGSGGGTTQINVPTPSSSTGR